MRKFQETEEPSFSEINVTPFVDVLLVLLVIFMITAPLITFDIPVNLPSSKTGKNISNATVDVILTVTKDHKIFLDSAPIDLKSVIPALKNKLLEAKKLVIFIQADKESKYGKIAEIMATLRNEGFLNLNLVLKDSEYAGD